MFRNARRPWFHLFLLSTVFAFFSVASADAGKTGPKRKVHVLLAGLTDEPGISRAVQFNLDQMTELLQNGLADHHRGEFKVLKGPDFNARTILDTIGRMAVRPEDTLFIYFHCHGAYDEAFKFADPSGGHFFHIDAKSPSLMRKDVWDSMRKHKAALTVLVTESCYDRGRATPFIPEGKKTKRSAADNPVLASLLLNQRGYIDINAASKGEFSWNFAPGAGGSFFTDSFVDIVYDAPFPSPSTVNWMQFTKAVRDKASNIYLGVRKNVLANEARHKEDLVKMFRKQLDQRLAVIQTSFGGGPAVAGGKGLEVGDGVTVKGKLAGVDPKDRLRKDSHHRVHEVRLEAEQEYVIELESEKMDMYLRLETGGGEVLGEDDDSGGGLNSRLRFRPAGAGVYRVIATTFRPGQTGDYTLRIRREGMPAKSAALKVGPGGLSVPLKLTGSEPRDRVKFESHHKVFLVHLEAGRTYVMDLESRSVDPFLRVENAAGEELASDDDAGEGTDARLSFRPTVSGTYRIIATTYHTATGDMTLRIREE